MARSTLGTKKASRKTATTKRAGSSKKIPGDAVSLLKADHRQVEKWFAEFEKSRNDSRKSELASKICTALTVHTEIEEELFYPAFIEATGDKDIHHEAVVEHAGAKKLIKEIEASSPRDDYYDSKVKVLSEMIKHHVKEEEQRGGMFAEAKQSDMDLKVLGQQMRVRKQELGAP
jgi:hemerythrin superfamily protein